MPIANHRYLVALVLLATVLAAGCGTFRPPNPPLEKWNPEGGYRPLDLRQERPLGEVVLLLAFSGGGTRAASFAYGVLQELRDTQVEAFGGSRPLLDEVDLISSVSGGSFASAYYGLYGDRIFEEFEPRFLRRDIERDLLLMLFNPINWMRSIFTFADRTELAIQHYDREIFEGATFADLDSANGPALQINAADLSAAARFTFIQPQFDLMCSDLSELKVARAVAASSAVPVVFGSVPLKNYAGTCGYELPDFLNEALEHPRRSRRLHQIARTAASYLDTDTKPYIHLVDGGVVDNQGLLAPMEMIQMGGGFARRFDALGAPAPAHIVVVAVDAEVNPRADFSLTPNPPSVGAILSALSGGQINRLTFETIELMRRSLEEWADQLPARPDGTRTKTHMIEVAFDFFEDPEEREYFDGIPTTLTLDDEQVDRLIEGGRRLLRGSPEFLELVRALGGRVEPAPDVEGEVDVNVDLRD